jgi:hypothetical protein
MAAFLKNSALIGPIAPASRAIVHVTATAPGKVTDIYGTTAVLGPDMNAGGAHSMPVKQPEPVSVEVQALIDEQGIDFEISGLKFLSNDARVRLS